MTDRSMAAEPAAPPTLSWTVGAVGIERIEENIVTLPTKVLLPDVTAQQLEAQWEWVEPYFCPPDEGGPVMRLSLHSFVVRSGDTTIVVDTCVGPDPERSLKGDPAFAERLDAAIDGGLAAVDYVICTHLHFDHVGWNTIDVDGSLVPTFPNARYLVTRPEIEALERDDHMAVDQPSIKPLAEAGVLDVIDFGTNGMAGTWEPVHQITDEIQLVASPGHTEGHVSVLVESEGATALITGDAFHSPIQVAYPNLAAWRFDSDSERSSATRLEMIKRLVESGGLVLGTHFAPPTAGRFRTRPSTVTGSGHDVDSGVWFDAEG